MNIDTMVESHFKKNRDIFGFESLLRANRRDDGFGGDVGGRHEAAARGARRRRPSPRQ